MKTEMKAMTELPYYKDIKLQNDRTYRVYLYPDSSPCAVDIDRRNVARAYRDGEGYGITAAGIAPAPAIRRWRLWNWPGFHRSG